MHPVLRPAIAACLLACAVTAAGASPQPGWVEAGNPGALMQYYVDASTVRRQGELTYYRLHGRGVRPESRHTTIEAEVGVDCSQHRRAQYITTTRWQDGIRTSTGHQLENVPPGSRESMEVTVACRLAEAATTTAGGDASRPLPTSTVSAREDLADRRVRWSGTGFAVAREVVVTNHHVVQGCSTIEVQQGSQKFSARLLATDGNNDLAALSVPGAALPPLEIAADTQELGESIAVLGYPLAHVLGPGLRVTTGVVSSLTGVRGEEHTMQISAAVQSGNSGGPVLDPSGAVAGVVVKKLDLRLGGENVNFAVRMKPLRSFLQANALPYVAAVPGRAPVGSVAHAVRKAAPGVLLVSCA